MTIETVARLDYSKPPPGYRLFGDTGFAAPVGGESTPWVAAQCPRDPLDAAWDHYKAHNDPPHLHPNDSSERMAAAFLCPVAEWRAAAWAWHDHRHRMIDRGLAFRGVGWASLNPWPRCLTWTDKQVDDVEHWLWDSTAEMPAVLQTEARS